MTVTTADPTVTTDEIEDTHSDGPGVAATGSEPMVEEDLLVEDVSIDGMCGVY